MAINPNANQRSPEQPLPKDSMVSPRFNHILEELPTRSFSSSQLVMDRHERRPEIYVIKSGRIKLKVLPSNGPGLTLRYLRRGEQVGLLHDQDEETDVIAEAITDTEAYVLNHDRKQEFARSHPEWFFRTNRQLYRCMNELWERFCTKTFYPLRTQILCVLCRLIERFGNFEQDRIRLPEWLKIRDLADMTASSPASVYRSMNELRASNLISTDSVLKISRMDRLRSATKAVCENCSLRTAQCPQTKRKLDNMEDSKACS